MRYEFSFVNFWKDPMLSGDQSWCFCPISIWFTKFTRAICIMNFAFMWQVISPDGYNVDGFKIK